MTRTEKAKLEQGCYGGIDAEEVTSFHEYVKRGRKRVRLPLHGCGYLNQTCEEFISDKAIRSCEYQSFVPA